MSGEDLSSLMMDELKQLEQELASSLKKVRETQDQLLQQQIENMRLKIAKVEAKLEQHRAANKGKGVNMVMLDEDDDQTRNTLQLFPLRPTQAKTEGLKLKGIAPGEKK